MYCAMQHGIARLIRPNSMPCHCHLHTQIDLIMAMSGVFALYSLTCVLGAPISLFMVKTTAKLLKLHDLCSFDFTC